MTLEELKALEDVIDWDDQYFAYISHRNRKLILLAPEILALVEAVERVRRESLTGDIDDTFGDIELALNDFNAKLGLL
jgi:hypothetical protein